MNGYALCITTSSYPGFACFRGEEMLFEWRSESARSQDLLPKLDNYLKAEGISIGDIGSIVVDMGPGSFTGLRIGLAAVKAWGYAFKDVNIYGISCLDVVAWDEFSRGEGEGLVVVRDAGRGNVYMGRYAIGPSGLEREYGLVPVDKLDRWADNKRIVEFSPPLPRMFRLPREWLKKVDVFELRPLYLYPDDCSVSKK